MKPLHMLDAAMRDIDTVRAHGRATARRRDNQDLAAVGACMDGTCDMAKTRPVCDSLDCNDLTRDFQQTVVIARALAGQAVVTVNFNPIDQYFCPVAIAGIGRDAVDGQTPRPFWLIQASIRGCVQYDWQNPADTVAGAVGYIDSSEIDPFARGGCACRVNYGCFTNTFGSAAQLQIVLGNPAPAAITTTIKLTLWGVAYNCCPGFTSAKDFQRPYEPTGPVPARAPQPMGNARQGAFARG